MSATAVTAAGAGGSHRETPRMLGYRMPAEWERHAATWIAWPHNANDWPGKFQPIAWVYADIVKHLSQVEHVQVLVNDAEAERRARRVLTRVHANLSQVHFQHWPTNRIWTRDSGPIFICKTAAPQQPAGASVYDTVAVTNWQFNAWAKYDDWQLDNELPTRVAELLRMPSFAPTMQMNDGSLRPVVLEGGSIDTNGAGVLLTTEECLLSDVQQRNPGVRREQLERIFGDYLGIDQVLWMNRGIVGDDTHGHVDDVTRFTDAQTIVTAVEPNSEDENHWPLAENLSRLRSAKTQEGQPFRIVELPLPSPVLFDEQRLPASYVNFYIANGLVLVPTFNDANDRHALNTLAALFPQHRIVGIHCGDLIWGLGALHCMTQQQPAPLTAPQLL